jgi:hypothetical protein
MHTRHAWPYASLLGTGSLNVFGRQLIRSNTDLLADPADGSRLCPA